VNEDDSLDPVAPWETLGRLCPPEAWDGNFLRPDFILRDDLMKAARGWSVQRAECTSLDLARAIATGLEIDPAVTTVAAAPASAVRGIKTTSGEQAFLIIENFLPGNPAHALVYSRPDLKRGPVKMVRDRLIGLLIRKSGLGELFR
jgi:hypothetical protein